MLWVCCRLLERVRICRFFIAIFQTVVNTDGCVAPDLVWSAGGLPKRRRVVHAVRDAALLPGPAPIWDTGWVVFFLQLSLLMTFVSGHIMLDVW